VCACFLVIAVPSTGFGAGTAPTPAGASPAATGHRLFLAGDFERAARQLEKARPGAAHDPEVLFELGICYERLGRDSEAMVSFREYQTFPLALRAREANLHLQAIEQRTASVPKAGEETGGPRHVVVPTSTDGGRCLRECGADPFPGRCTNGARCWAVQFSCLRSCPGARVAPGTCLTTPSTASQTCVNEGPK
jgi:hypothetical protein